MRRAILAVVAITAATAALASCSGSTPTKTAAPTAGGQHNAAYDTGRKIIAWYDATGTADSAKFATDAQAISQDGINGEAQLMSTHCSMPMQLMR